MGKFDEALRKAEAASCGTAAKAADSKAPESKGNEIDALRLDIAAPTQAPGAPSPRFSGKIEHLMVSLLDNQSVAAEQFRLLRTKIFCKDAACTSRAIMVTSPQSLDGKSTVAANLAVTIAKSINEHVLLVDCDLRRPILHQFFGIPKSSGISDYLEKGTSVAPYFLKTEVNKLTLLPAGNPPPNPAELLSSDKMRELVEELRNRYQDRCIIFDSAPLGIAAETGFLSTMMDGVLLVIRYGRTSNKTIMKAVENVSPDKILGIVFNAHEERPRDYKHYYRYHRKGK
jgi:exopolysaccharide/PEP-CTERM locus tyrosine autokinase